MPELKTRPLHRPYKLIPIGAILVKAASSKRTNGRQISERGQVKANTAVPIKVMVKMTLRRMMIVVRIQVRSKIEKGFSVTTVRSGVIMLMNAEAKKWQGKMMRHNWHKKMILVLNQKRSY